ncbi:ATP-binding protein [Streptomyces sp. NBC_01716]|uniref:ATP-binding protein n=1 Tax=Streptomyces sp. NBC_01716 TaxID=2975917 RepID=UPI002E2FD699|nr:ATP-binding protein [Streptomyces sp. NBC_01716]
MDDVSVVLLELLTNAIRYDEGYFAVRMSRLRLGGHSQLLIEVWDGSTDLPCMQETEPDAESGRGLLLVQGLVTKLGGTYGVSDAGRRTWCRIEDLVPPA